ncbi:MAG: hypothetical protein V4594_19770 [Bacteroidota bacterium]
MIEQKPRKVKPRTRPDSTLIKGVIGIRDLAHLEKSPAIYAEFEGRYVILLSGGLSGRLVMGYRWYALEENRLFVLHPDCLNRLELNNATGTLLYFDKCFCEYFCRINPALRDQGLLSESADEVYTDLRDKDMVSIEKKLKDLHSAVHSRVKRRTLIETLHAITML